MPTRREKANALRFLAVDAIETARSGHPGAPMGMADFAEVLWNDFLQHNPLNPHWWNRDRFILSNGHASALLYALLHLSGYDLTTEDLKNFRKFGSKTPGHPEYQLPAGVEMTTGPLGQGIATAVGLALAEALLAAQFNRPGFTIFNHYTYVFLGDGCLMEGISHEAASLAGTLQLGKLIAFWDDNGISIDGDVRGWFTENVPMRFKAYGWHVVSGVDGHDAQAVAQAVRQARRVKNRPSLICCKTIIGMGAPHKQGTASCHGSPLGQEELAAARETLDWPYPPFVIPDKIREAFDARKKGAAAEKKWMRLFEAYTQAFPDLGIELQRRMAGQLPQDLQLAFAALISEWQALGKNQATRLSSKELLNRLGSQLPELLGGSADLSGSVGTRWEGSALIGPDHMTGRYLAYGVREFGMGAIMNGLALHGGFIPYGGTFLVFSDYAKNAIRLAALMKQRVIWILTHDSIGMGEDGPTHQPVEQLGMLRLTPGLEVWRPCDAVETAVAWQMALRRSEGPSCLCLSRQDLPLIPRDAKTVALIERGAYIVHECQDSAPELILLATGSELGLAVSAAKILEQKKVAVRVLSMPCCEVFDRQDGAYREAVLPSALRARVAVEAAACAYWGRYVGLDGAVLCMHDFGASAPAKELYEHFGFTVERLVQLSLTVINACR